MKEDAGSGRDIRAPLLTPDEVVDLLEHRITTKTLSNWRSAKITRGPKFKKLGNRIYYLTSSVEEWMQANEFSSTRDYAEKQEEQKQKDLALSKSPRKPEKGLVCTPGGDLRIVLLARIPAPGELLRLHETDDATLLVDGPGRELPIKAELVATGKLDVVASHALSISDARQLASLYGVTPPSEVSFMNFQETGIYLRGSVPGKVVGSFSERCWSAGRPAP